MGDITIFGVVFTRVLEVFTILKERGAGGVNIFTLSLGGWGCEKFLTRDVPIL